MRKASRTEATICNRCQLVSAEANEAICFAERYTLTGMIGRVDDVGGRTNGPTAPLVVQHPEEFIHETPHMPRWA